MTTEVKSKILPLENLRQLMLKETNSYTTTNGWDILVSYTIDKLNACLEKEYSKNPLEDVIVKYSEQDDDDVQTMTFYLNLAKPTIEFSNEVGLRMRMPIGPGSQYDKGKGRKDLPSNYAILLDVTLQSGKRDGESFILNSHAEGGGQIVNLKESEEIHIAIYFDITKRGFSVEPQPESKYSKAFRFLREGLNSGQVTQKGQKLVKFDYSIMQVVSMKNEGFILTPKSFIFTMASYSPTYSVLNVWIETEQYGKTERREHPIFSLSSQEVSPVPDKYSASIIFSYDLMADIYFKKALNDHYDVKVTYKDLKNVDLVGGLNFLIIPKDEKKRFIKKNYLKSEYFPNYDFETTLTELDVNFENNPILLSSKTDGFHLSWKWNQVFDYKQTMSTICKGFPMKTTTTGRDEITASFEEKFDMTSSEDSRLSLRIDLNADAIKFDHTISGTGPGMFSLFGRKDNIVIPDWFKNDIAATVRDSLKVNIDFGDINYFSEANILFNEKRFNVDTKVGFLAPHDLMVVGEIA